MMQDISKDLESVRDKLESARRFQQDIEGSKTYSAVEYTLDALDQLTELVERLGKSLAGR